MLFLKSIKKKSNVYKGYGRAFLREQMEADPNTTADAEQLRRQN